MAPIVSRRKALKFFSGSAAVAILAACGGTVAPTATVRPASATSPATNATSPPSAGTAPSTAATAPATSASSAAANTTATRPAPTAAATTQGQVHVKFWNWLDNPQAPDFPDLIKQFEADHPGIKIDWELGAFATQHDKVISAFASGAGPDAFLMGADWIGQLDGLGAIEPLDPYFDKWSGKGDIYPTVTDQFRFQKGTPGGVGTLYGLPFILVAHYLYYRKDWASEVGFKGSHPSGGPATLDEFLQLAKAVTDPKKPRYGFAMRGAAGGEAMWAECGGSLGIDIWQWTNKDKGEWQFTFDSDKSIAANTWYLELYTKQKVCPPSAPSDSFAEVIGNMKSGLTCMTYHHTGSLQDLTKAIGDENLGVVPCPKGPDPKAWKTYGGASAHGISKTSKVKDAAFEFLAFIASPKFQKYWIDHQGGVPFNPSLADDPKIKANRFVQATIEGSPSWFVFPSTPGLGEFTSSQFPTKLSQALTGKITSDQMMKDLNTFMNKNKT